MALLFIPAGQVLMQQVLPNPSRTSFTLSIESNSVLPVNIRILDAQGREVNRLGNVSANSILKTGDKLKTGFYLAEIVQGNEKKL